MKTCPPPLRVAFLIGVDSDSTCRTIEAVCAVPSVEPVAILIDTAKNSLGKRLTILRNRVQREGIGYLFSRLTGIVSEYLARQAHGVVPRSEVQDLLRKSFPERCFSIHDISAKYGCRVVEVENLNSPEAAEALEAITPDIGIVLGTRILKRSTFAIPRLGCLNLHKGKVPEYRGMPPGFWELYEDQATAGITIHFVDDGLDTGDIVSTSQIPIHKYETEVSLCRKLDLEGAELMAQCVSQIQRGAFQRHPQQPSTLRPRTRPTLAQRKELARRRPGALSEPNHLKNIAKTLLYLGLYRSGVYGLTRSVRKARKSSRAAILLYHRVNDFSVDPLTTSHRAFAEHLVLLRSRYFVIDTEQLVQRLRVGEAIPHNTVAIHFDDCYRDVYSAASRLVKCAGLHATAFVNSGYVGTARSFQHDEEHYPFHYENLTEEQVRALPENNIAVAGHTVNHVDLGVVSVPEAEKEVKENRQALQTLLKRPVTLFSFPFGKESNIREDTRQIVREAGFEALFAAHGGFVTPHTDLFDIPRIGVSSAHRPLDLMMELEGISLSQLRGLA